MSLLTRWAEAALRNGEFLAAAEAQFEVIITSDQNLQYQQNLAGRRLALIVLPTNFLPEVIVLAPKVLAALATIQPGDRREIEL